MVRTWNVPGVFVQVDLRRAFGRLLHEAIDAGLAANGVPLVARHAIAAEVINTTISPILHGEDCGSVRFERGIVEGGPHSSLCLRVAVAQVSVPLFLSWEARGYLLQFDGNGFANQTNTAILPITWVDDIIMFSTVCRLLRDACASCRLA